MKYMFQEEIIIAAVLFYCNLVTVVTLLFYCNFCWTFKDMSMSINKFIENYKLLVSIIKHFTYGFFILIP